jgi:hypothetical protein
MPIKIYEIAKKHGDDVHKLIAKAKVLGFQRCKVASSSLDKITAEALEVAVYGEALAVQFKNLIPPENVTVKSNTQSIVDILANKIFDRQKKRKKFRSKKKRGKKTKKKKLWLTFSAFESNRRRH